MVLILAFHRPLVREEVDDRFARYAHGHEGRLTAAELIQPQALQAEQIYVERQGGVDVAYVESDVIEFQHLHHARLRSLGWSAEPTATQASGPRR